jgi:hypothetical protein
MYTNRATKNITKDYKSVPQVNKKTISLRANSSGISQEKGCEFEFIVDF